LSTIQHILILKAQYSLQSTQCEFINCGGGGGGGDHRRRRRHHHHHHHHLFQGLGFLACSGLEFIF
jgi:hypothetical protein